MNFYEDTIFNSEESADEILPEKSLPISSKVLHYGQYNNIAENIIPMQIEYKGFEIEKELDGSRLSILNNETDFLTKQGIVMTFMINMDRSKARLCRMINQCHKVGITNITRMQGFDGSTEVNKMYQELPEFAVQTNEQTLLKKIPILEKIGYTSNYGKAQQGCSCSHIYLWKYIVQNKLPIVMIIEDDLEFHPDFENLFTQAWLKRPSDGTLFNFMKAYDEIHSTCMETNLKWTLYSQHAAACYVITYEGALQLLEKYCKKTFPEIIPINDDVPYSTHETSYKLHHDNKQIFAQWGKRNCGITSTPPANETITSTIYQINQESKPTRKKTWVFETIIILLFFILLLFIFVIYKRCHKK